MNQALKQRWKLDDKEAKRVRGIFSSKRANANKEKAKFKCDFDDAGRFVDWWEEALQVQKRSVCLLRDTNQRHREPY